MKFRIPEIFLGVLLTVAVFSTGLILGLPTGPIPPPGHEQAQPLWIPTDSVGLYTMVLALFTALLVGVSALQGYFILRADKTAKAAAEAARQSADAATKSANAAYAAERARFFIVLESHNLERILENVSERGTLGPGENFHIAYHFVNYGKTPGIIKELTVASMIAANPVDPTSHPLKPKEFSAWMIGSNQPTERDNHNSSGPLHLKQLQAIARNSARFWFWGRLYYDDVFGNHHVHKFYFRSEAFSNGEGFLRPFDYKDHNKST